MARFGLRRASIAIMSVALVTGVAAPAAAAPGGGGTAPLTAPTGLRVSGSSSSSITLAWTDTNNAETGYSVERAAAAAGPFGVVGKVKRNKTSFTNSSLTAGTTYHYRVRALGRRGATSPYSTVLAARTAGTAPGVDDRKPTVPANFAAHATSCRDAVVSWNASTDTGGSGLAGYWVRRSGALVPF